MTGRAARLVQVVATALTALVLAHNLIFLAGYGAEFGDVLAHTGHDHGWSGAVILSLALGGALLLAAVWRLHALRRMATAIGATRLPAEPNRGDFLRRWLRLALLLAVAVATLFVLQENLELSRISQATPGIGVLVSAAYPNAIPIIAAVALAVSFVVVLLATDIDLVIARIRVARRRPRVGVTPPFLPTEWGARRPRSILGSRLASRAPPRGWIQHG